MKKVIWLFVIMLILFIGISAQTVNYAASNHTTGEVISEADSFITKGESATSPAISGQSLKKLSDSIYNILLVIGIIAAVIIGIILGINFVTSGVEGKADVQKALIVYAMGCVIVFGSFTIWKIVVTLIKGI